MLFVKYYKLEMYICRSEDKKIKHIRLIFGVYFYDCIGLIMKIILLSV